MYPDQSESHSAVRQNAVVSQRVSSEAIVATKAGTYTLPEVTLNWFNTRTNRQETAIIPAKTITIVAADEQAGNTLVSNIPLQSQTITPADNNCPAPATNPAQQLSCPEIAQQSSTNLLITLSGWIAWLLTTAILLLVLKKQKPQQQPIASNTNEKTGNTFDKKKLKAACNDSDAAKVRIELIKWAQQALSPSINDLQKLLQRLDNNSELAKQIKELNQSLYGRQQRTWNAQPLWQAFIEYAKNTSGSGVKVNSDLPPLN